MTYLLMENTQSLQTPLLKMVILLSILIGLQSCNQEEVSETDCMVSGRIISEYVDPEGNQIRIFENGEVYLIEEGKCNFAVQFFEPSFFEDNYIDTDSGTFLKVEENVLFQTFESFEENFEDYSQPLEFFISDLTDRSRFFLIIYFAKPFSKNR